MHLGKTRLRLLAGQQVPAVEVAMLFPGQAGAASFAIGVERTHATFWQVGQRVPAAQLIENRRVAPNLGEALAEQIAGGHAQLDARENVAIGTDQAGRKPNLAGA